MYFRQVVSRNVRNSMFPTLWTNDKIGITYLYVQLHKYANITKFKNIVRNVPTIPSLKMFSTTIPKPRKTNVKWQFKCLAKNIFDSYMLFAKDKTIFAVAFFRGTFHSPSSVYNWPRNLTAGADVRGIPVKCY